MTAVWETAVFLPTAAASARAGYTSTRQPAGGEVPSQPRTPTTSREETIIAAKLFVGNLNFKTTSDEIEALFSEVGDVVEVFLPTDRATGRPRGFAFVEFSTPEAAAQAIEKFNGKELDGRELRINEATERPQRRSPSFEGGPSFGGGHRPDRPSRPKGSRRNLRGKKRSL